MKYFFFCLAVAGVLVGCRDGTGPADPLAPSGHLEFSYEGNEIAGAFSATGPMDTRTFTYGTWAAATTDGTGINIVSLTAHDNWKADMVGIFLPGVSGTGTFALGGPTCDAPDPTCRDGEFLVNFDYRSLLGNTTVPPPDAFFVIREGTLTIASNDGERIRGSFSGTAVYDGEEGPWTIAIRDGSFDVPLVRR